MSYAFPEPGQSSWDPTPTRRSAALPPTLPPPPPPARASVSFWKLYFAVFLGTVSAAVFLAGVSFALFVFVLGDSIENAFDSSTSDSACLTKYAAADPATTGGDYAAWAAVNCS